MSIRQFGKNAATSDMKRSVYRLIDVFEKSMATPQPTEDRATARMAEAVECMLIRQFVENRATAGAYISLRDQSLRQA